MARIVLFIIPYYKIGGSEKVHLEIIKALPSRPFVLFSNISTIEKDNPFTQHAICFANRRGLKRLFITLMNIYSFFGSVFVFGSNNLVFYKVISQLRAKIKKIDLTHAFSFTGNGMEHLSLPYVPILDQRIVINQKTLDDYRKLYQEESIDNHYLNRFRIIPNGTIMLSFDEQKIMKRFQNFTIGFVGRNSPEKRPDLFFRLVESLGSRSKVIGDDFAKYKSGHGSTIFFESCNDPKTIRQEFQEISLLIVTSDREGFPLVIMEAMELGIPVVSTDVGSVAEHVINGVNGYLIPIDFDVNELASKIKTLSANADLYYKMSKSARLHAEQHFDNTTFKKNYRELLNA